MSNLIQQLSDTTDLLARLDAMTPQEAGRFYAEVQALKARFREWTALIDSGLIDYINEHGADIPIETAKGTKRLYVGNDRRTKCIDTKSALARLLGATGGDLNAVAECLASGAWKPGACRELLGDAWGEVFIVEEVPNLETGAPKRVLKTTQEE